jgi:hypothetical protein
MGWGAFAAVIASVAAVSTPAAAGTFVTGNDLLRYCEDPQVAPENICLGYVLGVADSLDARRVLDHVRECIPKGVAPTQVRDIVVKFLNSYPQVRQDPAANLIGVAVILAWDCGHP